MTPEHLGNGSAMNPDGDIVPIDDIHPYSGQEDLPPTNHEAIEQASETARRLFDDLGALASNELIDHEGRHRVYPRDAETIARERVAQGGVSTDEHEDAYASLGGGLRPRHPETRVPLENVLDEEFQPWQTDIRKAVEQFGMAEFSLEDIKTMKKEDLHTFCLHFYAFMEQIVMHQRNITSVDGDVSLNPDLRLEETYGQRTKEELLRYVQILSYLTRDLEATEIPLLARTHLNAPQGHGQHAERRSKLMHEASARVKSHHGKEPQVYRVGKRLAVEWRNK